MKPKRSYPRTQSILVILMLTVDILVCYLALVAAYWIRFKTSLHSVGIETTAINFELYQPLMWTGTILLAISYGYLDLYNPRLLLRPHRVTSTLLKGTFFWYLVFVGFSLILKFDPPISRIYAAISCITTFSMVSIWRYTIYKLADHTLLRERLTQRILIVGWSQEAERLTNAIKQDHNHPYSVSGIVTAGSANQRPPEIGLEFPLLGDISQLESILEEQLIDMVIIAQHDLPREILLKVNTLCELRYLEIKLIPSLFQIFVSNLRMQTISGVPILGVEDLPLRSLSNRVIKRTIDILGAIVGLFLSLPIIMVLGIIIRLQSPGPIFYRQTRTGRNGDPFKIFKLRSMRLDAESGGKAQWAVAGDPRRLPIGVFMREWNLDELPQFWNILIGDMSLVGPRPERPELIEKFALEIPHYNPRHEVRPGLTGWAQVNGLRGNTSLVDRIRYDLYYIENWSPWFDIQIILLTFVRNKNAY